MGAKNVQRQEKQRKKMGQHVARDKKITKVIRTFSDVNACLTSESVPHLARQSWWWGLLMPRSAQMTRSTKHQRSKLPWEFLRVSPRVSPPGSRSSATAPEAASLAGHHHPIVPGTGIQSDSLPCPGSVVPCRIWKETGAKEP